MDSGSLILGVLGTWRITHLLAAEDGPFELVARLRGWAGNGFWGSLLDCFYCLSLWISVPFSIALCANWKEGILFWLAFSAGAILLERATARTDSAIPPYREESTGGEHVLLRSSEGGGAGPVGPGIRPGGDGAGKP